MELQTLDKITRDMSKKLISLSRDEVRFLVNHYYIMQEDRKRSASQERTLSEEPHEAISWLRTQSSTMEKQIEKIMDWYTDSIPMGIWAKEHVGIGPIISAGLIAHIDIIKAPTAGHIWSFAGLDPKVKWEKGKKRPWNADLKTLCWKIGQSFMKFSNHEDCYYGHVYKARKMYETERNQALIYSPQAILMKERVGKNTGAHEYYSKGMLPPGHIDARARRYAVKIFLSHWHETAYREHYKTDPPLPYPIAILGHGHYLKPFLNQSSRE